MYKVDHHEELVKAKTKNMRAKIKYVQIRELRQERLLPSTVDPAAMKRG